MNETSVNAERCPVEATFLGEWTHLARRAFVLTGNRTDAQDLLQDTFERALRHYRRFETGSNAGSWMMTIMRRLFIDEHRRRRCRARDLVHELGVVMPPALDEAAEAPLWSRFARADLDRAIAKLSPMFRTTLEMRERDGLSYDVIAERLGIPVCTVGSRLSRARRRLRQELLRGLATPAARDDDASDA